MSTFSLSEFKALFKDSVDVRADIVAMARTAEAAERYEDMCKFMKYLVEEVAYSSGENKRMTTEERNLLSVAYKNVIGTRRASWRTLSAEAESEEIHSDAVRKYKGVVEDELVNTCEEVLEILKNLIPLQDVVEASVFYLKMAGDYYRYLAESVTPSEINPKAKDYPEKAREYYELAHQKATDMVATHPIRLGLALNYSVCYYEILNNKPAACKLAKEAFDEAISKLDQLAEADYKDSTLIMQLLRDNLTLWTSNDADDSVKVEDFDEDEM